EDATGDAEISRDNARFLAKVINGVCKEILPLPEAAMEYIKRLVAICNKRGDFLRWTSPSGFPVTNRYQKRDPKRVYLGSKHYVTIYNDLIPGPWPDKCRNSAPANYVHSM